jgi:L-fuconolactonase
VEIVDAQLHANEAHPAEQHVAMMDEAGVDAAVLVQTVPQGFDNSYMIGAAARHPGRFAVVGVLDAAGPDVDADVAAWRETPYAVGLRLVAFTPQREQRLRAGFYDALLAAAESRAIPVFVYAPRLPDEVEAIARSYPNLRIVLDHLNLPQPPLLADGEDPWQNLSRVISLARFPNVAVKWSALPTLSREAYPFSDLWPKLHRVLEAFGLERAAWGSDITRDGAGHTYAEAVGFVRETDELDDGEKALLLGGTLRKLLGWEAPAAVSATAGRSGVA